MTSGDLTRADLTKGSEKNKIFNISYNNIEMIAYKRIDTCQFKDEKLAMWIIGLLMCILFL